MRLFSAFVWSAALAATVSLAPSGLGAAQVLGPVAGGMRHLAPAGSDTWLAFPLREEALFSARITAVQAYGVTLADLAGVDDGTYSASAGEPRYYAEFVSGHLAGLVCAINTQSGGTLNLDTEGLNLSTLTISGAAGNVLGVGDVVRIRRAWTIKNLFEPITNEPLLGRVTQAPDTLYLTGDALLFPERGAIGVDLPEKARVVYQEPGGWRASDAPPEVAVGHRSVLPGRVLGVRRQAETDLAWTVLGYVPGAPGVCVLPVVAPGEEKDVAVGWMRPALRTLDDSGLDEVLKLRPADGQPGDRLLLSEAVSYGLDTAPAIRAERVGDAWHGEGGEQMEEHLLADDSALVLRLRGAPQTRFWREGGAP